MLNPSLKLVHLTRHRDISATIARNIRLLFRLATVTPIAAIQCRSISFSRFPQQSSTAKIISATASDLWRRLWTILRASMDVVFVFDPSPKKVCNYLCAVQWWRLTFAVHASVLFFYVFIYCTPCVVSFFFYWLYIKDRIRLSDPQLLHMQSPFPVLCPVLLTLLVLSYFKSFFMLCVSVFVFFFCYITVPTPTFCL